MSAQPAAELEAVTGALARAGQAQVLKVLNVVDSLSERGEADAIVAPLRARLGAIGTPHPLRLPRLLFLPVDTFLVNQAAWQPGLPCAVPRTAIAPLTGVVRAALGAEAGEIERSIAGRTTADATVVHRIGARLWPKAAAALRRAADHGGSGGLPPDLLRGVAVALDTVPELDRLYREGASDSEAEGRIAGLLAAARRDGPFAQGFATAACLQRFPSSGAARDALLGACRSPDGISRAQGRAVIAATLAAGERRFGAADRPLGPNEPVCDLRAHVALICTLLATPAAADARAEIEKSRIALAQSCVARFELTRHQSFGALAHGADPAQLEASARVLKRFEMEARVLGGAAQYDQGLRETAQAVTETKGLARITKARLVEMLIGSDAAMDVLRTQQDAPDADGAPPGA